MSKKAVIVPKHKWGIVEVADFHEQIKFHLRHSRSSARIAAQATGLPVRKVTKIVYYYE